MHCVYNASHLPIYSTYAYFYVNYSDFNHLKILNLYANYISLNLFILVFSSLSGKKLNMLGSQQLLKNIVSTITFPQTKTSLQADNFTFVSLKY